MIIADLSEGKVAVGLQLTARLARFFQVRGAFWLLDLETNSWKLFFALPEVDIKGPRAIYSRLRGELRHTAALQQGVALDDIGLLSVKSRLYQAMRSAIRITDGTNRLSHNVFNGLYVPDAVVYRMT